MSTAAHSETWPEARDMIHTEYGVVGRLSTEECFVPMVLVNDTQYSLKGLDTEKGALLRLVQSSSDPEFKHHVHLMMKRVIDELNQVDA